VADRLKERVAVITGSGQGIGRTIALAMAKEGAQVVTNNRWQGTPGGDAEATAKEIIEMGGQAIPFFGDISSFDTAEKLVETAIGNFGRVDILVNNAGAVAPRAVWEMSEEDWDKVIDSHLKGAFNCIRHASALMIRQRWGRILNATSVLRQGVQGFCSYSAAKAGVVGLTRAVAMEVGEYGVTCNAYSPIAATRINLSEGAKARRKKMYEAGLMDKKLYQELSHASPPEVIPPLLIYLCTDEAANINGQVFHIAGGDIALCSGEVEKNTIHKKKGLWTIAELVELVPKVVLKSCRSLTPTPPAK
jgi:NAD(P)-dependent dehydrogenase (short-subunit alcohol dehydrogenase family)